MNARGAMETSIVQQYEVCGLTAEEIAGMEGMEVAAVKAVLLQSSRLYRDAERAGELEKCDELSDEEMRDAYKVLVTLATYSDNDGVRLKAANRIIDEKKGRLTSRKALRDTSGGGAKVNILIFNRALQALNERKKELLQDVVDVEMVGSAR